MSLKMKKNDKNAKKWIKMQKKQRFAILPKKIRKNEKYLQSKYQIFLIKNMR